MYVMENKKALWEQEEVRYYKTEYRQTDNFNTYEEHTVYNIFSYY